MLDNISHICDHFPVLCPFLHEALKYFTLAFGIDQIEINGMLLHKAVYTGYRLELIVEAVVNEHDCFMTMILEVQTFTKHLRFSCKVFQPAIFEVGYYLVGFFIVL